MKELIMVVTGTLLLLIFLVGGAYQLNEMTDRRNKAKIEELLNEEIAPYKYEFLASIFDELDYSIKNEIYILKSDGVISVKEYDSIRLMIERSKLETKLWDFKANKHE